MFNSLKRLLVSSGYANWKRATCLAMVTPILFAISVHEWLKVPGLSIAVAASLFAIEYEVLSSRRARRQAKISQSWPLVIESLESAAVSGMSLLESLRDLGESDQLYVSREFAECCLNIDSGLTFDFALDQLKDSFANHSADFTIELVRIANSSGSDGYVSALRNQSNSLRQEAALKAQLEAKQGWVVGTAKLAVVAPWLIVAVLSFRPENAATYRSLAGTGILILGLFASAIALRMVYRIGSFTTAVRVFG
jgi:tight adherence protein B